MDKLALEFTWRGLGAPRLESERAAAALVKRVETMRKCGKEVAFVKAYATFRDGGINYAKVRLLVDGRYQRLWWDPLDDRWRTDKWSP